jgi:hypothetical protein
MPVMTQRIKIPRLCFNDRTPLDIRKKPSAAISSVLKPYGVNTSRNVKSRMITERTAIIMMEIFSYLLF